MGLIFIYNCNSNWRNSNSSSSKWRYWYYICNIRLYIRYLLW